MQPRIDDSVRSSEEVAIAAFQSAGLLIHTRTLSRLTEAATDPMQVATLATATILMAAAAVEAVLTEAAFVTNRPLYVDRDFRRSGAPEKFTRLLGTTNMDVYNLWEARKALAHAEPDNQRTRFVGQKLDAAGAQWAVEVVRNVAVLAWPDQMPSWLQAAASEA